VSNSDTPLHLKLIAARRRKGFTQEELADLAHITVRTIQRIESGEGRPRAYTLKVIASILEIPFEDINDPEEQVTDSKNSFALDNKETKLQERYFFKMLTLSCFSYLVIPYVHFLIPAYLLKKRKFIDKGLNEASRRTIVYQIYWVVAFNVSLLAALGYNLTRASYYSKTYLLSYLHIFLAFYILNAFIIIAGLVRNYSDSRLLKA
jgi:transcriptional regulator with XRE-family HTH domain